MMCLVGLAMCWFCVLPHVHPRVNLFPGGPGELANLAQ